MIHLPESEVVNWLRRSTFSSATVDIYDQLVVYLNRHFGSCFVDQSDLEDFAKRRVRRILSLLRRGSDEDNSRHRYPVFVDFNTELLTCRWFPATGDSTPKVPRALKRRLALRGAILSTLERLNWREYEALGCLVMRLARAARIKLTEPGNDGGVDWFALVPCKHKCHLLPSPSRHLRIVGQSKKYNHSLNEERVRSFFHILNDLRTMSGSIKDHVPSWFWSSEGPIVGMMVAHSGFDSGAIAHCRREGVIAADSWDIAETLSLMLPSDLVNQGARNIEAFIFDRIAQEQTSGDSTDVRTRPELASVG